jgi:A/G-specific adenine glycosylase
VLAYSFNQPVVFIETNIRSVYLHHFFNDIQEVNDKQILGLIQQTLSREHPREWYWALMDYGTCLKKQGNGRLAQSVHHKKQAPLKGSLREMRGRIIKVLSHSSLTEQQLKLEVIADDRFEPALQALLKEQLIKKHRHKLSLA